MRANDIGRAIAFYRDTLGLPFLFEAPRMAFFDLAGLRLMLGEPEGSEHDRPGSCLYFRVADIERAHRELAARGVAFRDSEANLLALMSEVRKD
jgi:predicted enzyme related to lactoylglutathione lyase